MPNVIPTVETPITRQYIGARYVPIFDGAWDNTKDYAPLTIVSYQGNSYTSKTYVPSGIDITNDTYWALSGNYNAQVESYRQEVLDYKAEVEEIDGSVIPDFKSIRLFSTTSDLGNAIVVNGSNYVTAYVSSGNLIIKVLDSSFDVIDSFTYVDVDIHVNAMFIHNNKICIVDSDNYDVYVFNKTSYDLEEKIESFESLMIVSGAHDDNGDGYLYSSNGKVYFLNDDFTIDHSITLASFIANGSNFSPVIQGIFVYDGYIYRVYNVPNILAKYNLEGKCIGVVDIGYGNGYYPYGEVESFCVDGDNVYLISGLYSGNDDVGVYGYMQLFKTNIGEFIGYNSIYGQKWPVDFKSIVVKSTSTDKNPDGTTLHPFKSAFEASCVYNYLYHEFGSIRNILLNGDLSNDIMIFDNCNVSIVATTSPLTLKALFALGADIIASDVRFTNLISYGSKLDLTRCWLLGSVYIHSTKIDAIDLDFNNASIKAYYSSLDGYCLVEGTTNIDSNSYEFRIVKHFEFLRGLSNVSTSASSNNPDVITLHACTSGGRSIINIRGLFNGMIFDNNVSLEYADKQTIINNGSVTKTFKMYGVDTGNMIVSTVTLTFTKDDITMMRSAATYLDGTDFTGTVSCYRECMTIENFTAF